MVIYLEISFTNSNLELMVLGRGGDPEHGSSTKEDPLPACLLTECWRGVGVGVGGCGGEGGDISGQMWKHY